MSDKKIKYLEEAIIEEFARQRKHLGYSYEKMAELTGLHRTSVSLIERNKIRPTLQACLKLAEALELKLEKVIEKSR